MLQGIKRGWKRRWDETDDCLNREKDEKDVGDGTMRPGWRGYWRGWRCVYHDEMSGGKGGMVRAITLYLSKRSQIIGTFCVLRYRQKNCWQISSTVSR